MKTLSIVVPCYNSEGYMRHCIESLLIGGDEVEILIVNDGSKDGTKDIANEYEGKYPGIVRAFHQENGGHGAAVTTGIQNATGKYFKVVDSDDWVNPEAYKEVLCALGKDYAKTQPDMVITNFVYEKQDKKHKKVMRYASVLPLGTVFGWNEAGRFRKGQYLLMHAIIYRLDLLRQSGLVLPRHTFYVDNLYAYIPLKNVKHMLYLDVNFYRYFIGREGQSVQEDVMMRRIDQQLLVNRNMLTSIELDKVKNKRQREYMFNYLEIVTVVSSVMLLRSGTRENADKKAELWDFIRSQNKWVYKKLKRGLLGRLINLPGQTGRGISLSVYKVAQKVVGFN